MPAAGFIVSFVLILYLSIKKVRMDRVMLLATVIVALTSNMGPSRILSTVWSAFKDPATLQLAAAVLAIGLFSTFMREFSFMDRTVTGLTALLGNIKAAIMSVPALIGSMPVLGGAALSAPLVDKLGEPLDLGPDVKAAANLAFRHGTLFVLPFSSNLILAANLTGFPIGTLISRLWPMSVAIWGIGYLVLLRKAGPSSASEVAATATAKAKAGPGRLWGLGQFALYGGPLLTALLLGLVLKLSLWLSLVVGTLGAIALALYQKRALPAAKTLLKGANLSQVVAMFWIMAFKGFVVTSPVFPAIMSKISATGISPALVAMLVPLAFGFGSASQTTTLAVLIPLLVPASAAASARLYMTCLVYSSSFTAYFYSPLHMCQVLTCDYFKVDVTKVYRRNWPILVGFFSVMLGFYFLAQKGL